MLEYAGFPDPDVRQGTSDRIRIRMFDQQETHSCMPCLAASWVLVHVLINTTAWKSSSVLLLIAQMTMSVKYMYAFRVDSTRIYMIATWFTYQTIIITAVPSISQFEAVCIRSSIGNKMRGHYHPIKDFQSVFYLQQRSTVSYSLSVPHDLQSHTWTSAILSSFNWLFPWVATPIPPLD